MKRGFTLIELLVVIAVIALLMGILLPVLAQARSRTRTVSCAGRLQQIGLAVRTYADDNTDFLPRCKHSAKRYRVLPWGKVLMQYVGAGRYSGTYYDNGNIPDSLFNGLYRCPSDPRRDGRFSYGKNAYFDLEPDYDGNTDTNGLAFPRISQSPSPWATILFGELAEAQPMNNNSGSLDHFMGFYWPELTPEVDQLRHDSGSNYLFLDGHVLCMAFSDTFNLLKNINKWNPYVAQ